MQLHDIAKNKVKFVGLFVIGMAGIVVSQSTTAHAVDTQVSVSICGQTAPAAKITVSQPASDSVVDTATTTFRGSVEHTSGLEVEVDGGYSSTIALAPNQTSFTTDVILEPGTHTIKITANGICGAADAAANTVLTYQPKAQTSTGATTPTRIDVGGVSQSAGNLNTSANVAGATGIETIPVIGPIARLFAPISKGLGLEATVVNGGQPVAIGLARVAATSLSVLFLAAPNVALPLLAHGTRLSQLLHWSLPKQWSGIRGLLGLRLVGAVIFGALLLL